MKATTKTWGELEREMATIMRKWRQVSYYEIRCALPSRSMRKVYHDLFERRVTVEVWHARGDVTITIQRHERAQDNLAALCQVAEMLRIADVRDLAGVLTAVYRKWYPAPAPQARPQASQSDWVPQHYKIIGVLPTAPMEVVEAAYKALVKIHHPDRGGITEVMQGINAAMDTIRKGRGS